MYTPREDSAFEAIHDEATKLLQLDLPDQAKEIAELIRSIARHKLDVRSNKEQERVTGPQVLAPRGRGMETEHSDIRIVGFDEAQSYKRDPGTNLYRMYLKLSHTPPSAWQMIFLNEHYRLRQAMPPNTRWRYASVEKQYIVIVCLPEELEQYHLQALKEEVKQINSKYAQHLAEEPARRAQKEAADQAARDGLKGLNDRLNFDDQ